MTIPIQFPQLGGQQVISGTGAPDPLKTLMQALLQGANLGQQQSEERGRNSRSSTEAVLEGKRLDIEKAKVGLQVQEAKIRHEREATMGAALQEVLPQFMAMGGGAAMMQQQGMQPQAQQGAAPPTTDPVMQAVQSAMGAAPTASAGQVGGTTDPTEALAQLVAKMPPEMAQAFLKDNLPLLQQVKQIATRERIGAKYAPPADGNETAEAQQKRLGQMAAASANAGDHSMVASLAEAIGVLKADRDTTQYEWFQNKDGTTVYLPKKEGSDLRLGKPTGGMTGFGFGPGGPVGVIRAITAIEGMRDAHDKMKRFEVKVASKQISYTDLDFFRGKLATMYDDANKETGLGHYVPFFGTATGSAVLARLNRTNPDLANYLQSAAFWALEESVLANRPSDFRTKMDEFVSAIKPDAKVQSIHDLWTARSVRLHGFEQGLPALKGLMDRAARMSAAPGVQLVPQEP